MSFMENHSDAQLSFTGPAISAVGSACLSAAAYLRFTSPELVVSEGVGVYVAVRGVPPDGLVVEFPYGGAALRAFAIARNQVGSPRGLKALVELRVGVVRIVDDVTGFDEQVAE
jgi:hypothetical protein